MFGYVVCDKGELKIREFNLYRAHYCGVCKAIKARYGITRCALLTYDAAALALGASACIPTGLSLERCVVNPFKKVPVARGHAADYAADCNVFLAVGKLADNYEDDKNLLCGLGAAVLGRSSEKALDRLPKGGAAAESLQALKAFERERCDDVDLVANCFGNMLGALMSGAPVSESQGVVLENIGFNLGRWIYLIDAFDDLAKDEKKGSYNVLLQKYGSAEGAKVAADAVEFNLITSLAQAGYGADLLESEKGVQCAAVLKNIIDGGCYKKTFEILRPELHKGADDVLGGIKVG